MTGTKTFTIVLSITLCKLINPMPKQDAIVDIISENLEELRTLLDDRAFTSDDYSEEQNLINNIEILLMQLR